MERDMTLGKPGKTIFQFALPIFIGNVFQQLYSMADTIIVGKVLGEDALAAVGSTGILSFLLLGLSVGMTMGFTVPTAQYFGAGDLEKMRKSVASAAVLSAIVTAVFTLASMLSLGRLLTAMKTPENILEDAYAYMIVICGGLFAQVLYNLLSSILRALGNSKAALYFLVLSAGLNILLDLLLVITFSMGTAGAAYATVISQGVSGLACLLYIWKKVPLLHLSRKDFRREPGLVKSQIQIGLPMALQFSITAIGGTMVQVSLNKLKDSVYIAAFTAGSKIENLLTQAFVALGSAMATFAAQNTGAGKYGRIRQGFRITTLLGSVYAVAGGVLTIFCGKYLTYLFVDVESPAIVDYVGVYLTCVSLFFIPLLLIFLFRNGLQGMGFSFMPMMAGVAELVGRAIVSVLGTHYKSYTLVCMAGPVAWVLAALLLLVTYWAVIAKRKKLQGGEL